MCKVFIFFEHRGMKTAGTAKELIDNT